ncbi:putative autotransporter [Pandoraea iniqua]|uniref:Putative autotransporter n=1 Tax=Pandoraea iniqua TaxID=2508288 RepID=A0A5E4WNG7_9BURK|nr:autotransporter outer membrane beta-barrel domain-containing protein [Pandoraea iniqua]VVE24565.1 putative autotransporter [Pandoraea iniqua]
MRVLAASVFLAMAAVSTEVRSKDIVIGAPCIGTDLSGFCNHGHNEIDGNSVTVTGAGRARLIGAPDRATSLEYLRVLDGGTVEASNLTISGHSTADISSGLLSVVDGSRLSLTDSTVINTGDIALSVGRSTRDPSLSPAIASLDNVSLKAVGRGVLLTGDALLEMWGGEVIAERGTGRLNYAVQVTDSAFRAYGARLVGADHAVVVSTEVNPTQAGSEVILSGATLESEDGAAISIYRERGSTPNEFDVSLAIVNGTTIKAGNGTLIEVGFDQVVDDPLSVEITVDNSRLEGDIKFKDYVDSDLTLSNHAVVTGRIEGADRIHLNDGGEWRLIENSQTANIAMQGGIVDIHGTAAEGQYHTLTVGSLSGTGTFRMGVDLVDAVSDQLHLTGGDSTGDFNLAVKNTGTEAKVERHQLVQDDGGAAGFSVLGDKVDFGAYSYSLQKEVIDGKTYWHLVRDGGPSAGTDSILGIFSAIPTVWSGEAATLRTRLGEVRMAETKEGGVWARTFGNRHNASPSVGQGYSQDQWGLIAGADRVISRSDNGTLLVGAMAGTSSNNLKFNVGSTGSIESYTAGVYATWLGTRGYYLDTVLKYNHYQSELDVRMRDGQRSKGDFNSNGVGVSAEFGRKIALANDWFVEPYSQISAMTAGSAEFTLDNGMTAKSDRNASVQGTLGVTIGKTFETSKGNFQPYVRAAVVQEFAKNNKVRINDIEFNNDLSGTRGEPSNGRPRPCNARDPKCPAAAPQFPRPACWPTSMRPCVSKR